MAAPLDQIMIDTETLATGPNAVILSIGAVKFSLDGKMDDSAFYASCSVDSQPNRHISESTLVWWMGQSDAARKVFTEPKVTLESALNDFIDWIDHDKYCVWSNGADFDIPLVKHAMDQFGLEPPWKFWNQRCFRTLKSIPPGSYVPKPQEPTIAHNAVADAIAQVAHLHAIFAHGKPGAPVQKGSYVKRQA